MVRGLFLTVNLNFSQRDQTAAKQTRVPIGINCPIVCKNNICIDTFSDRSIGSTDSQLASVAYNHRIND